MYIELSLLYQKGSNFQSSLKISDYQKGPKEVSRGKDSNLRRVAPRVLQTRTIGHSVTSGVPKLYHSCYTFFMCFLKPLKVKSVSGKTVLLDNGIKAFYEKKVGILKPNDIVMVYGNLILEKISNKNDRKTK